MEDRSFALLMFFFIGVAVFAYLLHLLDKVIDAVVELL